MPFAGIHNDHLQVIAEGISTAWADLRATQSATLQTGTEAEINALMQARLSRLLDEDRIWALLVRAVTRGTESLSFDGRHLEKRPDLSIHLTLRNSAFPLVVECKLIDPENQKGCALYCDNGLMRFLNGEYAWATREAIIIGYVRDGSSVSSALTPFLKASQEACPKPYQIEELPLRVLQLSMDLERSRHGRDFTYPAQKPSNNAPGEIAVWHLWLDVAPVKHAKGN